MSSNLTILLTGKQGELAPVVPFDAAGDKLVALDLTAANTALSDEVLADTTRFSHYINQHIANAGARYAIGGYAEHRTVYKISEVFDGLNKDDEPRRLHLGTDIWGDAGTPVSAPLEGSVHSFAFNDRYGDYGATVILQHELNGLTFHALYGHLNLASLENLQEGTRINKGDVFAAFGELHENGHWPPHLHFQLIIDMKNRKGDYPGVCRYAERELYLANSPDPDSILGLNQYL